MILLAIDPGDKESGYVFMESETYKPIRFGKEENSSVLLMLQLSAYEELVIERIASYGMAVGRNVFETCEWVGRFTQAATVFPEYVYRREEKINICGNPTANDANIRMALIDRFAEHDFKRGKGTKKNPDFFYGFKADVWQAFAVGVTYLDKKEQEKRTG